MRNARGTCGDAVPLLLLSATVPTAVPTAVANELQLACGLASMLVVRAPSTRANIALSVETVHAPHGTSVVFAAQTARIVQLARTVAAGQGAAPLSRMLVLVPTIPMAKRMAVVPGEHFGAGVGVALYHGELTSAEQEAAELEWTSPGGCVMVATSGFGTGVSYGAVRIVVHVDSAYSAVDMAQELGRGGRDGQPCQHVLLVGVNAPRDEEVAWVAAYARQRDGCRAQHLANAIAGFGAGVGKKKPEAQRFLGLASYYRRFIDRFSEIAEPLMAAAVLARWSDAVRNPAASTRHSRPRNCAAPKRRRSRRPGGTELHGRIKQTKKKKKKKKTRRRHRPTAVRNHCPFHTLCSRR